MFQRRLNVFSDCHHVFYVVVDCHPRKSQKKLSDSVDILKAVFTCSYCERFLTLSASCIIYQWTRVWLMGTLVIGRWNCWTVSCDPEQTGGMVLERTCVGVHREVRVSLADAVDQFSTVAVHPIIGVCGGHLDD